MKAQAVNLMNYLKGPKQFIIPIYQRTYSWTRKECAQLWDDIIKAGSDDKISGHFIGSVVYIERGIYQVSSIPQLLVIDGQQRLTTLFLLLAAFGRALQSSSESLDVTKKKIDNYFLLNIEEDGELHYKLILTQTDTDTLKCLIDDKELPEQKSVRISENNDFFVERIKSSGITLETIYKGISKLIIVDIALDRSHDNPQLIFESLNSTGLELSQADLIRNYILMRLEPGEQSEIYNKYWYAMEKRFGQTAYITQFDRFMRDYLTLNLGRIPIIGEVYHDFKIHAQTRHNESIKYIVADINHFSKCFVAMALEQEQDKQLLEAFQNLNNLKVDVAYPFLLELYDDYSKNILNKDEFIEIVQLIESYVFRRAICGIPTNSLNKTFATLCKESNKSDYLMSFKAVMALKDSYRRFPIDDEFMRELKTKDLYNFRSRNYWLRKLENHNHKENINTEELTIEHIMPQNKNLPIEWQNELGVNWKQIQEQYIHTLGNLTLTGYNSELSDRPFLEKRDMQGGFADSHLRLNKTLATLEHWNEDEIKNRAESLARLAVQVWTYPAVPDDVLIIYKEKEQPKEHVYTLADHSYLTGEILELFNNLRRRILNLDASVKEEILKLYIAYKTETNFVDVVPQKNRLRLSLNMSFNEIDDPKGLCRDITGIGRWGNGDIQVGISSSEQLDDVMYLIKQSFQISMDSN
ncbi:DUF262 and DUF1524 domain-containing protein [Candidatus Magnetomonas plexicatena]|uniref:DUF262 and DUF1524 domain-containing protein n=1 Tax=Candidatus Magnetomonas plexicatena TaxID=2552947 RepID=UPI001C740084|nr:DUF262 domain-containing protein [Nitrospirales bacterium LBB_01]